MENKLERAQYVNSILQSVAIVIAGFWALGYTFWYSDLYRDSKQPTEMTSRITLEPGISRNGRTSVLARMEIKNESERDVHVLPGVFVALGASLEPANYVAEDFYQLASEYANLDQDQYINRYFSTMNMELVSSGGIYSGLVLSPDGEFQKTFTFFVPEGKFELIEVIVSFWAHKGDADLWAKTKIIDHVSFSNQPCVVKSHEPFLCEDLQYSEKTRGQFTELDLWLYETKQQTVLPIASLTDEE